MLRLSGCAVPIALNVGKFLTGSHLPGSGLDQKVCGPRGQYGRRRGPFDYARQNLLFLFIRAVNEIAETIAWASSMSSFWMTRCAILPPCKHLYSLFYDIIKWEIFERWNRRGSIEITKCYVHVFSLLFDQTRHNRFFLLFGLISVIGDDDRGSRRALVQLHSRVQLDRFSSLFWT